MLSLPDRRGDEIRRCEVNQTRIGVAALATEERRLELTHLVRSCNERWTVTEMSERARRQGATISPSELAAYAADEVVMRPSTRQVRALAAALDLRVEVVAMAASRQFSKVPRPRVQA